MQTDTKINENIRPRVVVEDYCSPIDLNDGRSAPPFPIPKWGAQL